MLLDFAPAFLYNLKYAKIQSHTFTDNEQEVVVDSVLEYGESCRNKGIIFCFFPPPNKSVQLSLPLPMAVAFCGIRLQSI